MSFANIPDELKVLQSGIYRIKNIISNKFYIGNTSKFKLRWNKHKSELSKNSHPNRHLQFAWNKYGSNAFVFEVIEYCTEDKLIEREQFWIDCTNCCDQAIGYNLAPTAESPLGIKRSEETKKKMSEAIRNRPPISAETRAKMSASAKLKKITQSCRDNMAKAQTGRKHSEATKAKMRSAQTGIPKSEQHKINNGKAHQKFDKWPHKGGRRCTCRECQDKKNAYNNANYYKWKKSNE